MKFHIPVFILRAAREFVKECRHSVEMLDIVDGELKVRQNQNQRYVISVNYATFNRYFNYGEPLIDISEWIDRGSIINIGKVKGFEVCVHKDNLMKDGKVTFSTQVEEGIGSHREYYIQLGKLEDPHKIHANIQTLSRR